jgi:hypothetical protein
MRLANLSEICYNTAMNSSLFRLCLSILLMIAIPLQGFAASSATLGGTSRCGMSELEMLMAHPAYTQATSIDQANDGANDRANQADEPIQADMPNCQHCSPHCTSASFSVITNHLTPPPAASAHAFDFPALIQTLPMPPVHSLERPPRA